jgi:hypothetical protein
VRRLLIDLAVLAVLATIAFAVVLSLHWTSRERTVDVYLLSLGGLAMLALVTATSGAAPSAKRSPFDAALRRPPPRSSSLPTLEKTYRETVLGIARTFDFHVRLRPVLREIASQRLVSRRGLELDAQPDAVRAAIGDEAYELLRPGRLLPDRRFDPGVDAETLHRVLDALERL